MRSQITHSWKLLKSARFSTFSVSIQHINGNGWCSKMLPIYFLIISWSELFPLLEKQHGADKCYSFENNVFPNPITLPPPGYQTLPLESLWCPGSQYVPGVNILAHLYQEPIIQETRHNNGKMILNPRGVISPDIHILAEAQFRCSWVDRNMARMYHIR